MITGIAILIVFLIFASLMYFNLMPALLALPLMAVAIAAAGGVSAGDILTVILTAGSYRLAVPIVTVIFGSVLGQFMEDTGIARTMVRAASEFSSDRPLLLLVLLTMIISLLFTVLGGLGSVIMVGTIVFPIMLSVGIPRIVAAGSFLIAMSAGGIFNLINWQLYKSLLGVSGPDIMRYAFMFAPVMFVAAVAFMIIELSAGGTEKMCAVKASRKEKGEPWYSLLTPLIPIVLVFGFSIYNLVNKPAVPFDFPIISAMIIALAYGSLTVRKKQTGRLQMLTRSAVEGISKAGPAVLLIIGIGMLLSATTHPLVAGQISPLLLRVLNNKLYYVLCFGLLAPLSLYRGPLNIWGMGAGIMGLLFATGAMPAIAIMAAFMAVGQIQGVCDPTNTHNIWIANYLDIGVQKIMMRTLPYIWTAAVIGIVIAAANYF